MFSFMNTNARSQIPNFFDIPAFRNLRDGYDSRSGKCFVESQYDSGKDSPSTYDTEHCILGGYSFEGRIPSCVINLLNAAPGWDIHA